MTPGRHPTYTDRAVFTTSFERAQLDEFKNACSRSGVDMNQVLSEAMRQFTDKHRPQDDKISRWFDPDVVQRIKTEEIVARPDFFKSPKNDWVGYLHSLPLQDAARCQGVGKFIVNVAGLVVQNRKNGIKPTPYEVISQMEGQH